MSLHLFIWSSYFRSLCGFVCRLPWRLQNQQAIECELSTPEFKGKRYSFLSIYPSTYLPKANHIQSECDLCLGLKLLWHHSVEINFKTKPTNHQKTKTKFLTLWESIIQNGSSRAERKSEQRRNLMNKIGWWMKTNIWINHGEIYYNFTG